MKEFYKKVQQSLEITRFNITLPIDENFDKERFFYENDKDYAKYHSFSKRLKRKLFKKFIRRYRRPRIYKHLITDKRDAVYDLDLPTPQNAYFEGCFQSLYYFAPIADTIRREFTLKFPLKEANLRLKERILSTPNATFCHIRRGDYHESDRLGAIYYENAIKYLKNKLSKPHIFVFSNDMPWCENEFLGLLSDECKENVEFSFISANSGLEATQEMELMRSCRHGIIANSTFSWWASYLLENPEKIIIMPHKFWYFLGNPPHPYDILFKGAVLINKDNGTVVCEF